MNPVIIGSARHDEFGGIGYGSNVKPGDQTGSECETQEWYLHEYGWTVIRPKSQEVAERTPSHYWTHPLQQHAKRSSRCHGCNSYTAAAACYRSECIQVIASYC